MLAHQVLAVDQHSIRMITTGSSTPFNTCDKIAKFISCASGSISTVTAPPAISSV